MDKLPLFIESICIKNQKIQLLDYHNTRANNCISAHFKNSNRIDLTNYIDPNKTTDNLVKCRIVYNNEVQSVEYQPYSIRPIRSLQVVDIDPDYSYKYKSIDRERLVKYFNQRKTSDDIIMARNGYITDSYYANLAFLKEGIWYTPNQPLLEGTRRAYLLDKGEIVERQISKDDISVYEKVRLFNAMIEFGQLEVSISEISF